MPPIWLSHYEDIERLQLAWQAEFKKRARGGAVALSGFHYQFLVALHDTLRAWLGRPTQERGRPKVFTECLSDIIDRSADDIVLVTQVKRTSRSESLRDALTELWVIYDLALRTTPNLVPYLRFRILSRRTEREDFERVLNRWHPPGQDTLGVNLDEFRKRITVDCFFDPEDEVLAILANDLRATDPTGYVQRWLGELLSGASKDGLAGFEYAARLIWNDLQSIENSSFPSHQGIYVWTSQDKNPEKTTEGDILTGERPQVHHLRQGYFASRSEVYQTIFEQAWEWALDVADDQDRQLRLPIFWIGGRSGSGKSVALLHVLSLLYESGLGLILWLGNKTELLRQAIPWALKLAVQGRQVIIGIDDPYAPNTQGDDIVWKEALAVLENIRQAGDASALPLILCCGPSEQSDRMKRDLPEEVTVSLSELREENQKDILELRGWYTQRTKEVPPAVGDDNVLLVQLFFEWKTGEPLPEFASRFRNRLIESDPEGTLEDVVTRMLCVNRLYVGYPNRAVDAHLTPELQDTFLRLHREHHIGNFSDRGIGFWFAHPHLSNVIYESWYPLENNRLLRSDHLRRTIKDSIEFGSSVREKMAPLWAISNATSGFPEQGVLVGRLDQETIINLLPVVYSSRISDWGGQLPVAEMPVWIQMRAFFPTARLIPDPVDVALIQIRVENVEETGLRLTCHKVLQHYNSFSEYQRARVINVIAKLLAQAQQWYEWAPIAHDAYRQTRDPRFVRLILDWVSDYPTTHSSARLFLFLFNSNSRDPQILNAARGLLPRVGADISWGDVALQLIDDAERAIPLPVLQWAENNHQEWGACFLIGRLLSRKLILATEWAFAWCERWHAERSANYVLEPLIALTGPNEQVRLWCMRWIAVGHGNADSGFLVERMLKTSPYDSEVFSMGLNWLENNPEHRSWYFVWRAAYGIDSFDRPTDPSEQTTSLFPALTPRSEQLHMAELDWGQLESKRPMADGPRFWYYLAKGLNRANRSKDEITALKKALEMNPQFHEAWQALGATYNHTGEFELAFEANQKLTELRPDDAEAWYYLSIASGKAERFDDEKAAVIRATQLDPEYVEGWQRLGATYDRLGETTLALDAVRKLVELRPKDAEAWYYLAVATGKVGRLEEELAALLRTTELDPQFAQAWRNISALLNQLGKYDEALAAALKVTEIRPDDHEAWYRLSIAQSKVKDYEKEIVSLQKATTLNPGFLDGWTAIQGIHYRRHEYDLALEVLQKVIELKPEEPTNSYFLGVLYFKRKRFKEAAAALLEATALRPDNRSAQELLSEVLATIEMLERPYVEPEGLDSAESKRLHALGRGYVESGQIAEAAHAFQEAIQASSDATTVGSTLEQSLIREATAAFRNEAHERAIILLRVVVSMNPNIPDTWRFLSRSYRRIGKYDESLDAALHLNKLAPEDAGNWYILGKRYVRVGQTTKAIQAFNQALNLNGNLRAARRELQELLSKTDPESGLPDSET